MTAIAIFIDNGTEGPYNHSGGPLTVTAKGTWGNGTLSFQADIGGGFVELETLDDDGGFIADLPGECRFQFVFSESTSPDLIVAAR